MGDMLSYIGIYEGGGGGLHVLIYRYIWGGGGGDTRSHI